MPRAIQFSCCSMIQYLTTEARSHGDPLPSRLSFGGPDKGTSAVAAPFVREVMFHCPLAHAAALAGGEPLFAPRRRWRFAGFGAPRSA